MSIFSILIFVFIGVFFLYASKKFKRFSVRYNLIQKLPGPKPLPLLGHVFLCLNDDVSLFRKARYYARKYGPIYAVSMTYFYPTINITGTEELEKVGTTKYSKKSIEYQLLQRWLGTGLLTSKGSQWQTRRKILTPAFHFTILQQFVTIFNQEVERLIEHLKDEDKKPFCNIVPFISQFTLYSITETSMGTTLNAENEEDKNYITAIHKIGKVLLNRLLRPWLFFETIYKLLPVGKLEIELVNCLHSFTDKIILKREETFEKFEVTEQQSYNYSKKKKLALLDLLLNAKISDGLIDNQGIRDEVNTFLFEGHDTTSTSICFTLMLLANHQNYQDLVYKEIISVLGDSKKNPDINDLNELKYMERCIKESLRLYPSVPFIAKCLEEDTTINGYFLPKNAIVHIHIYDIHRNPKYWPDPDKYDPDRFLIDNCVNRHPLSYIPFSAGPRNCIGQRFAILELKAVLCGILRNFILLPVDSPETIEMIPDLVLRTKNNTIRVKLCKRHPAND